MKSSSNIAVSILVVGTREEAIGTSLTARERTFESVTISRPAFSNLQPPISEADHSFSEIALGEAQDEGIRCPGKRLNNS